VILYGSSISPFVRKVIAFASEKGITLEVKTVGVADPDPTFRKASPLGKMPALDDDGFLLADSSAIVHYLEAKVAQPRLIPTEAQARGRVIWFDEFADTMLMGCAAKMFFNRVVSPRFLKRPGDLELAASVERDELPKVLGYLESVIPQDGFLVGDSVTLADLAVASPLANFPYMDVEIDASLYPRTKAFAARILARPSFAPVLARERALLARAA
jgi:glutathione S-transferase